jgi:hypothetical protein
MDESDLHPAKRAVHKTSIADETITDLQSRKHRRIDRPGISSRNGSQT